MRTRRSTGGGFNTVLTRAIAVLLIALLSMVQIAVAASPAHADVVDDDHDSYTSDVDCDDTDPDVFPGAAEVIGDGVDQDCDATEIWYDDSDEDGSRTTTTFEGSVSEPAAAGRESDPIDCDDEHASVHPGAVEVTNGVDDDCDGFTDEEDPDLVNTAPTLDDSKSPTLAVVLEDAPAPSGPIGTKVASLIELGNVYDPDPDALGIAVTAVDTSNGSLWYSLNGSTWSAFPAVSGFSSLLLPADATTRVYFQPSANVTGSVNALTFRAWDTTTGTSGALADTTTNGRRREHEGVLRPESELHRLEHADLPRLGSDDGRQRYEGRHHRKRRNDRILHRDRQRVAAGDTARRDRARGDDHGGPDRRDERQHTDVPIHG